MILFFDDFETNDPLGSYEGLSKFGAVYLAMSCLPPELQSELDNIFLFLRFNSLDRKEFENASMFLRGIAELNTLSAEGITINYEHGTTKIYFSVQLIIGDNLGMHTILGFCGSFRANYFGRFCTINLKQINRVVDEGQC